MIVHTQAHVDSLGEVARENFLLAIRMTGSFKGIMCGHCPLKALWIQCVSSCKISLWAKLGCISPMRKLRHQRVKWLGVLAGLHSHILSCIVSLNGNSHVSLKQMTYEKRNKWGIWFLIPLLINVHVLCETRIKTSKPWGKGCSLLPGEGAGCTEERGSQWTQKRWGVFKWCLCEPQCDRTNWTGEDGSWCRCSRRSELLWVEDVWEQMSHCKRTAT